MRTNRPGGTRIYTAGGGMENSMSLQQLTRWCDDRFGSHTIAAATEERPFDIPWIVMSNANAAADFGWRVETPLQKILEEIATHAAMHPDWLALSRA